jgi:predicted nucleic acid-binding protein
MATTVIDASAVCAVLFNEPESDHIAGQLEGASLAAPALLLFEVVNSCIKKIRSHPEQRAKIIGGFNRLEDLQIETIKVDHADLLLLAEETGLTGYDASYLWLALDLDAQLLTLDHELATAHALLRRR